MAADPDGMRRNQSLVRGLALLRALADRPAGATVPDLAELTDLPRTTTARLLTTLHDLSAVEREGTRVWVLGPEIARIGRSADPFRTLRDRAYAAVQELSRAIHESAMIAVVYDTWETETILQVDAQNLVGTTNWLGQRHGGVLHAAATGKLALAKLDSRELRREVGRLQAFTPHTITRIDALVAEMDRVRERSWATTVDELEIGLTAVAVPLDDRVLGPVTGVHSLSLSVSGPSARLPADRIEDVTKMLTRAAGELVR